jgi:glycosyltransferase involved in cell wall biosynthesis
LPGTLEAWRQFLSAQSFDWEVIVVDDGSRDATADIAAAAGSRVIQLTPNRGKGGAVRQGVLAAEGDVIAYVDADLNIAPVHLSRAIVALDSGADLVVGQRDLAEYAAAEGSLRLIAGGLVQLTRRLVVLWSIRDTQCGFKVFRRELARKVFTQTRITSFAFDIEVLFLAKRIGARIVEMPVHTVYRPESTFSLQKHLPTFLTDIIRIRLNDLSGRYG